GVGAVPAYAGAEPDRFAAAHPLHVRGAEVRRAAVDDGERGPVAAPDALARHRRAERVARPPGTRRAAVGAAAVRGHCRRRRRQLLVVDGQHLLLLSGAGEGLCPRAQRRGRQPRRGGGAAVRAAGRDRGSPRRGREAAGASGAHGVRRADVAAVRGGGLVPRLALHGQPHPGQGRHCVLHGSAQVRQTWIMSFLYIGTFGSFIGFSFALPLVIKNTFPEFLGGHPFIATYLAGLGFMGALIGSLSRPLGGWLSDRLGGARVTLVVFVAMALATATAITGVQHRSFALFFGSYMVVFLFAGMGNGSTYKMIPSIFAAIGQREAAATGADPAATAVEFKRRAAAVIGIAGAIG